MAHNFSPQTGVSSNPDPALETVNEHPPTHFHHGASALKGEDDLVYATDQPHVASGSAKDKSHLKGNAEDVEKGAVGYNVSKNDINYAEKTPSEELDPKRHVVSRVYRKYNYVFHALLAAIFTAWWIASLVLHRVSLYRASAKPLN